MSAFYSRTPNRTRHLDRSRAFSARCSGETPVFRAVAFLSVIPYGNLLVLSPSLLPLLFWLSSRRDLLCRCRCLTFCDSLWESASAFAVAVALAFLVVIPQGSALPLSLPLLFFLSFPLGICFCLCRCRCPCFSGCHPAGICFAFVAALAFLSVIPSGNLLLPSPLPFPLLFWLSSRRDLLCLCRCPCFSFCHSLWESASAFAVAVALAFLVVIPQGSALPLSLPLPFFLSFPLGICFCLCRCRSPCFSGCHPAGICFAFVAALAFLSVIPSGNLLLPLPS